ncbi:AHH domain-containing protein [Melittangium boletus]
MPDGVSESPRVEDVRALLADFHTALALEKVRPFRLVRTGTDVGWEQRLKAEFLFRYGSSRVPLPRLLETSPLFMALTLSTHHMGAGVRAAAWEMFNSPVFLSSVVLSILVYFSAWMLPEPLFSKAFVAALTLRLSLAVGAVELSRFARVCVRLYLEAQAARSMNELDIAAKHFGEATGATGLRILMVVASMGLSKALPEVPEGGLGALFRVSRHAATGPVTDGLATVQMMADGTILVTGVATATMASSLGSGCADGSSPKAGHQWHHLATNKNHSSDRRGGPWSRLFAKLFAMAGLSMDAAENLVYLNGHAGTHSEAYHTEVYRRLEAALEDCGSVARCKKYLTDELQKLAEDVCTPGSRLHRLLTGM